jgi:hypothetical protein
LRVQKFVARGGLVSRGRHRPAYSEATLETLLDVYEQRVQVKAGLRARTRDPRKADAAALKGFREVFHRVGSQAGVRYSPIDTVVREAFPHHRPPVRHTDVIAFCERDVLEPAILVGSGKDADVVDVKEPNPLLVPSYTYFKGECL